MTREQWQELACRLQNRFSNLSKMEKISLEEACTKLAECVCRECGKNYDNRKARGEYLGFCSAKCQHAKARKCGYRKGGTYSEFRCLKARNNVGDIPVLK